MGAPSLCRLRGAGAYPKAEEGVYTMYSIVRKIACAALAALLLAGFWGCGKPAAQPALDQAEAAPAVTAEVEAPKEGEEPAFLIPIREITKRGNVILDTTFEEMKAHDMEIGDILTVRFGETVLDMPVGTSYTDVDTGCMLCRFDMEDNEVALGINMGAFASESGLAVKQTMEEDPGYRWDAVADRIGFSLKEKKGYLNEYNARNLTRTNERADYPTLTDEEFANFRAVRANGIRENWLYRSSTPVEPAIGRNEYAMAAMEKAGIRTVVNLDDTAEEMKGYDTFPNSYYSRCQVINPEMSYDFTSADFAEKVRVSAAFLAENEGPYLIHCKEGKDRTGILCAILECFAGATAEQIQADYMLTYRNFYGIEPENELYDITLKNLIRPLCGLLQVDDLSAPDLQEKAAAYLLSTGLTAEQLSALGQNLGF